jgi:hypothetical protein
MGKIKRVIFNYYIVNYIFFFVIKLGCFLDAGSFPGGYPGAEGFPDAGGVGGFPGGFPGAGGAGGFPGGFPGAGGAGGFLNYFKRNFFFVFQVYQG